MNKDILKSNEDIAKFMGDSFHTNIMIGMDYYDEAWLRNLDDEYYSILSYHESWDWLMPVIDKIESLGYFVKISTKCCSISTENRDDSAFVKAVFGRNKLENIYLCVSYFAKYINNHEKKTEK